MALECLENKDLKLIIFGGKGGVGKSVCAIATALALSKNFKTLLISTDPAHSVSDCLEQEIGFKVVNVDGTANMSALEVDADKALSNFKTEHRNELKKLFDTSTNLDSEDIDEMLDLSIPGIDEMMSFKTIIDFIEEGGYDKYVVDTAPTGHALRLISSPKLLDDWIKVAARMRWKYRYMVTSFSGSYQQDEVDALLFSLKKIVKRIQNLLRDKTKCEFIPVCIPEAMATMETDRLLADLSASGIIARQIIVNNVMVSDDGDFCKRVKANQLPYLQEIKKTFSNLNIVQVPKFAEEIKGLEALDKLRQVLTS
ncbi:ATPase [Flavobacterium sp. GSP27]|uniref:arsenite-transporting ATPase n=1 Tax=Flavobacterium bomense TaxID=2497483 RepID=A0A432CMJ4_9FLAO|nr:MULTISPECIES: ArsA family ATPase [Flavobacterium]RTY94731.1 ATPase [Flavobacterium sp. GSN2]RTY67636.1 ATPase [Flavobacterium sp. LB2P53]RTY73419.1 ATPase [Flavobacterium sp. LS1R10]RTY81525.1 ATPase [Flavobacterium sp. ZB4P23]RTY81712.1 ATPase [Flavobacterium sp. LS1P28]